MLSQTLQESFGSTISEQKVGAILGLMPRLQYLPVLLLLCAPLINYCRILYELQIPRHPLSELRSCLLEASKGAPISFLPSDASTTHPVSYYNLTARPEKFGSLGLRVGIESVLIEEQLPVWLLEEDYRELGTSLKRNADLLPDVSDEVRLPNLPQAYRIPSAMVGYHGRVRPPLLILPKSLSHCAQRIEKQGAARVTLDT